MALLVGFSFFWVRRQHYETFLIVHIIMSVIVLVTMLGLVLRASVNGVFLTLLQPCLDISRRVRLFVLDPRRHLDRRSSTTRSPNLCL